MSTRAVYAFTATLLGPLCAVAAHGDVPRFGPRDVASVFFVSKSENDNQVHYGIHLDERCAPRSDRPVAAYWRMLERGPKETDELLGYEEPAYGIAWQEVTARRENGGTVRMALRALSARVVEITTLKASDGSCTAVATTPIAGAAARLRRVHVQIAWPFGVDRIVVSGAPVSGGPPVNETIAR